MMVANGDDLQKHIVDFLEVFYLLESSILAGLPQLNRLSDVVREARGGRISRQGTISSGMRYQVHGRGCVMIGSDGAVVNVDFLADGRAAFDVTRLEDFMRSTIAGTPILGSDLLSACRLAARSGIVEEVQEGWFAVPV